MRVRLNLYIYVSPGIEFIQKVLLRQQISQSVFARLTGIAPSNISAMLGGKAHIPHHPQFVDQVITGLGLNTLKAQQFREAVDQSPKGLQIQPGTDREIFLMVATLRDHIDVIDSATAKRLRQIILSCHSPAQKRALPAQA